MAGEQGPLGALWSHIFGDQEGLIGLFSGIRLPGAKQLGDPRSTYVRYPAATEYAERWLRDQAAAG